MSIATRDAHVTWEGTLVRGQGQLSTGSGSSQDLPMDWESRSQDAQGATSPEELLAAAEAGCYAMSLALGLQRRGHKPDRIEVDCTCDLDKREGEDPEYVISRLALDVRATVPGLEDGEFQEIVEKSDRGCPVSNAVRGNVEVALSARLEG